MKNKKIVIIIILLGLIGQLNIIKYCTAFPCNLIYMNSDNEIYHLDEEILINASWDLNYNPEAQISYIKVQIFNSQDEIIWESPNYDEIGLQEDNWTININNLNLSVSNSSLFLYIKFFLYFYNFITGNYIYDYLKTIQIQILKKDVSYQLSGFTNRLDNEDNLNFFVKFFFDSSDNITYIVNQTITVEIMKDDKILYRQNFTTNDEGSIQIIIFNIIKITTGHNIIRLILKNNPLFNNLILDHDLFIGDNEYPLNSSGVIYLILIIPGIIIGSLIILAYKIFKKSRQKSLAELTIEI